jgi:Fusaric acid resistance protein-like
VERGFTLQELTHHQKQLAGLARGLRAAIVVPTLFALGLFLIKQPQLAGFSVFGTFAHLVMVNYGPDRRARAIEAATLTSLGVVLVTVGCFASLSTTSAVVGAVLVGFGTEWPALARGPVAVTRTALLLSFMLAVAVPTTLRGTALQLAGWVLAGLVAQPMLQWLWIPIRPADPITHESESDSSSPAWSTWLPHALCAGMAAGTAILVSRILHLEHAFWVVLGMLPVLTMRDSSPLNTFWREQAGTLLGFLVGAALVSMIGGNQQWYWILLPGIIFASTYASTALGLTLGQAGFTAFVVVLFCILSPAQKEVGRIRLEDIAMGGVVSVLVASLQRFGETLTWTTVRT